MTNELNVEAWIEHHKGGDNLVWDNPGKNSSALVSRAAAQSIISALEKRVAEMEIDNANLKGSVELFLARCEVLESQRTPRSEPEEGICTKLRYIKRVLETMHPTAQDRADAAWACRELLEAEWKSARAADLARTHRGDNHG